MMCRRFGQSWRAIRIWLVSAPAKDFLVAWNTDGLTEERPSLLAPLYTSKKSLAGLVSGSDAVFID